MPIVSTDSRLVKFNTNQSSEVVMWVLEAGELEAAGDFPSAEEELTAERITAVQKFLKSDICPDVDFAVWVPHSNRKMRKLNAGHDVLFRWIDYSNRGLPNIELFGKSHAGFRSALISWKTVGLGRLDMYANMIKRHVSRNRSSV